MDSSVTEHTMTAPVLATSTQSNTGRPLKPLTTSPSEGSGEEGGRGGGGGGGGARGGEQGGGGGPLEAFGALPEEKDQSP